MDKRTGKVTAADDESLRLAAHSISQEGTKLEEAIYLRALEASDVERCLVWHNDRNLYETLVSPFRFVSRQAEQAWIEKRAAYSSTEISLAICVKASHQHIGNAYLREIDWISRNSQLGVFIGDQNERAKGFGQAAIRQLLWHAFFDLGIHKVCVHVLADNEEAIHVYQKCGFRIEGRLKNHVFKKGDWKDLIAMGICSENYAGRS